MVICRYHQFCNKYHLHKDSNRFSICFFRLSQWVSKGQQKKINSTKQADPKQKTFSVRFAGDTKQKSIFWIFKKDAAKSTQGRDTSTKVMALYNTK